MSLHTNDIPWKTNPMTTEPGATRVRIPIKVAPKPKVPKHRG